MKKQETSYEDLINKINSLQHTLSLLKNELNSVYTMCNNSFGDINAENESKDIKNDGRK
jgi:hypothetical protein|tara:strand:- start:396 stop:572 length:177 start_codon:yes stop_codon:yes gene_type:complete